MYFGHSVEIAEWDPPQLRQCGEHSPSCGDPLHCEHISFEEHRSCGCPKAPHFLQTSGLGIQGRTSYFTYSNLRSVGHEGVENVSCKMGEIRCVFDGGRRTWVTPKGAIHCSISVVSMAVRSGAYIEPLDLFSRGCMLISSWVFWNDFWEMRLSVWSFDVVRTRSWSPRINETDSAFSPFNDCWRKFSTHGHPSCCTVRPLVALTVRKLPVFVWFVLNKMLGSTRPLFWPAIGRIKFGESREGRMWKLEKWNWIKLEVFFR